MTDTSLPHRFEARRELGRTGFKASILGIGDLADRNVPLQTFDGPPPEVRRKLGLA